MLNPQKYAIAFLITAAIFGTAVYASNILTNRKVEDVRAAEDQVAQDILSSETQFSLLAETSCKDIGPGFLSQELGPIGEKLSYAENSTGFSAADVNNLKESYFLLEIKDYLLMKQVTAKCGFKPTFILYFYSTKDACTDCEKMGYVLTALHEKYPDLRVYSFDYNFDLGAIDTLTSIYKVKADLPAIVVNGETYYGFKPIDELQATIPALKLLKTATSTATTTRA